MTVEDHYRALAPRLTNWLVATGSTYEDARDLVQQTFLKLWEVRDDLQEDGAAVSGLVFTIAKNLRKNFWRKNNRIIFTDQPENAAQDIGSAPPVAEEERAHLRNRLRDAFAQLAPPLREAYTLFQIGELSVREIAHETGATEDLVKVRIFRAKQRLRQLLADVMAS